MPSDRLSAALIILLSQFSPPQVSVSVNYPLSTFMQTHHWLFIWNVFGFFFPFSFRACRKCNQTYLAFQVSPPPRATHQTLDQAESASVCSAHFRRHSEKLQLVSSIQMKQAGSQMRPVSPQSRSGGARRESPSQIQVRVNDSSNSLSCVMLTARLRWINSDAHSRPGIWFQMEHKSGTWNVQFCYSFKEAYWELVPGLL